MNNDCNENKNLTGNEYFSTIKYVVKQKKKSKSKRIYANVINMLNKVILHKPFNDDVILEEKGLFFLIYQLIIMTDTIYINSYEHSNFKLYIYMIIITYKKILDLPNEDQESMNTQVKVSTGKKYIIFAMAVLSQIL